MIWSARRGSPGIVSLALTILVSSVGVARADDEPAKAMAEALFDDGKALLEQGHTAEACAKFASSQQIDPQIGTLLFLATCHEAEGKTATAWAEFHEGLAQLERAPNPKREAYARQRLAAVSARLSRLVLAAASPPPGLVVKVDDRLLDAGTLGTPLPVDPGAHTIEAVAPGRKSWSTRIVVAAGPIDVPVAIPSLASDGPPPPAVAPPPPPAPPFSSNTTVAYVVGGMGIAGLVVGTVFGIVALSDKNTADHGQCSGPYCTNRGLSLYQNANTMAWVSNAGFAVGILGVGVGGYLLLFGGHAHDGPSVSLSAMPGGASLAGAW